MWASVGGGAAGGVTRAGDGGAPAVREIGLAVEGRWSVVVLEAELADTGGGAAAAATSGCGGEEAGGDVVAEGGGAAAAWVGVGLGGALDATDVASLTGPFPRKLQ